MSMLDWSNFDGPKRNPDWKPDLQDLIYTAINFRDDEYGDADDDAGQQIVERLLAALRAEQFDKEVFNAHRHELLEKADEIERLRAGIKRLSDEEELCAETTGDDPFSLVYLTAKLAAVEAENKRLLASMRRVEDYHRAKAAGIWETSREGLTEDQSKEYGIAWCVHAAAAYEIKQLASPDTPGDGAGWTLPDETNRPEGYRCLVVMEIEWARDIAGHLSWARPDEHWPSAICEGAPGVCEFLPLRTAGKGEG